MTIILIIPPLNITKGIAIIIQEKAEALKERFYPEVAANTDDIQLPDFPLESFTKAF